MHVHSVELLESHAPSLSQHYAGVIGGGVARRILSAFMLAEASHPANIHAKICENKRMCHIYKKNVWTQKSKLCNVRHW